MPALLLVAAALLIALVPAANAETPGQYVGIVDAFDSLARDSRPNPEPALSVDILAQASTSDESDAATERRLMMLIASLRTAGEQERQEVVRELARHEQTAVKAVEDFYREGFLERMEAIEIIRAIRAEPSDASTAASASRRTDTPDNADAPARTVAEHLVSAASAADDNEATYESATLIDGDVRISGFEITDSDGSSAFIDTLTVRDFVMRDQGGFTADTIEALRGEGVDEDLRYSWETAMLENVVVPTAEELAETPNFIPAARLRVSDLEVRHEDASSPATVEALDMQFDNLVEGVPHAFAVAVDRIVLPREALDKPEHRAMLARLEYEEIVIDAALDVRFDRDAEEIALRRFVLKADDVGRFELSASIGEVRLGALEEGDFETLLDSFTLIGAETSFHNDGAIERGLEMQAEETGMDAAALRQRQINELRAALATLNNPAFEEEMASVMEEFLQDPRTLRITASPNSPLSAMQLFGMAMMAPQTLPDVLGLNVIVNE